MSSRLLAVLSLCCLVHSGACAQSQRDLWLKHLKLMGADDPKADILIETQYSEICEALKQGDPGLAKGVMRSAYLMLDNEGLFSLVAYAVLYNSQASIEGLRALPEGRRESVIEVLPAGAELVFTGGKNQARYLDIVRRIEQEFKKQEFPDDGLPAVIDDPDGYTNVRKRPDKTSKIVDVVKKGQRFMVLDKEDDWYEVETPSGEIGYMHASRVKFVK